MPSGVDYSFSRPDPAALYAAGYRFAMRYLTGSGKALTLTELHALNAAGISVGVIAESSGNETLGGAPAGDIAGRVANAACDALGIPADRPIYYTVDYDDRGHPGCLPLIAAFLEAAQHGRREARAYGSVRVVDYLRQPGWQTAAWSGSAVSAHAAIYQHDFQVNFHGSAIDINDARVTDFGQYPAPHVAPPAPVPPSTSTPIEDAMTQTDLSMRLDQHGNGWKPLANVKAKDVRSFNFIGISDPAKHGYEAIPLVSLTIGEDDQFARIVVEHGLPNDAVTIRVIHA